MEFDNRYTAAGGNTTNHSSTAIETFKTSSKPPTIAPVGIHGALQMKFTNASAKLLANYDYKKSKQFNAKS